MPRDRPQLSITLPRNFTFHYTEGEGPKTPEQDIPLSVPHSPHAGHAHRRKLRHRSGVNGLFEDPAVQVDSGEIPIPTIETPMISVEPAPPKFQQRATEPVEGYLAPIATRKFTTLPRTPISQLHHLMDGWTGSGSQDIGESISRPMSACSILSDSSDDSSGTLTSYPAGDGSCTSPEDDLPDPFKFASIRKSKSKQWTDLLKNDEATEKSFPLKPKPRINWSAEMDKHLWSTYHIYLQDPTVTPFKMLPGTAPPLGVCHRVAREARRTWHGGKAAVPKVESLSPLNHNTGVDVSHSPENARPGSPDTVRANRSGSNTPTGFVGSKPSIWPKSGSSTRKRLRYLCKSKPSIAPHYQRLLQSRSPSPFSSSPRTQTRSHSRLSEVSSPVGKQTSSFNTRDIQISLTSSTASTMQPGAPLGQLTSSNMTTSQPINDWFNEPPVPWASPTAIPSDTGASIQMSDDQQADSIRTPRLGSPFGFHTWGPSRSRQRVRPSTPKMQSSDASTFGPYLRSPVRFHDGFPYPGVQKRRARHNLEDELSPGGSSVQGELPEDLFKSATEGRHRRVRSRGFSLGDVNGTTPLERLFTPPSEAQQPNAPEISITPSTSSDVSSITPTQIRRLGSPFHGIAPRTPRGSARHMATMSLGGYEPFLSIDETLGQNPQGQSDSVHLQR